MPVTELSVMIGAAIAPNATGAVLANNETTAALMGFMPAAISMAAEMATGAPKPASDSSSAPKQNAMRMAWMRWSSEMDRILIAEYLEPAGDHRQAVHPDGVDEDPQNGEQRRRPHLRVSRFRLAPAASPIRRRRSRSTAARLISADRWAGNFKTPSMTKSDVRGMAATSAESTSDPAAGSSTCWNWDMGPPDGLFGCDCFTRCGSRLLIDSDTTHD